MDSTTRRKGPGTAHILILMITLNALLISGASVNSDLHYGNHGISDLNYGAPIHSDTLYGTSGTSKPSYGAHETSHLGYGTHDTSYPGYGSPRNSDSIYNSGSVYGASGYPETIYGPLRHSDLTYGVQGTSAPRSSVPINRDPGNLKPVYGSPGHSDLGYGSLGHSDLVYGAQGTSEPNTGAYGNSGTVYGASGHSDLGYGSLGHSDLLYEAHGTSEPFHGAHRSSVSVDTSHKISGSVYGGSGISDLNSGVHGTSDPMHGDLKDPETVNATPRNPESIYRDHGISDVVYGAPGSPELIYDAHGNSDLLYGASGTSDLTHGTTETSKLDPEATEDPDLASGTPEQNCSSLVGFEAEVPLYAVNTTELRICNSGNLSCCTPEMEEELVSTMEDYFIDSLQSNVKELSKFFEKNHHKLVKNFIDVVELNRNESIDIFARIYGILFSNSSKIFSIYDHITSFYKNGYDEHILTDYFKKQFINLFEMMNSHYQFDDKFKKCMETQIDWMEMVSPKDTKGLMGAISRSVTGVRAYTQGLIVGRDAIRSLMWYEPNKACVKELVRMRGCIQCSGNQGSPICADYCLEVLAICFAKHMDFSNAWADYYYAMQRLQEKIENEYNIDDMINSLSIKLSDLIMDFQENSILIHKKVFNTCGKPMHSSIKDTPSRVRRYTFPWNKERKKGEVSKLIKNIQKNLQISFLDVCKNEQVSEYNCWSGTEMGNFTRDASPGSWRDASKAMKLHPDAIPLRLSTRKLRAAIDNHDVKWLDYEHKIFEICWIGS